MRWITVLFGLVLALVLGQAFTAFGQQNTKVVIVIADCRIENGDNLAFPVQRGESLTAYHWAAGRVYVLNESSKASQRPWGWIDASCVLRPEKALTYFSDALAKNPSDTSAYLGRAGAEQALGQYDKAIADCNQLLQLDRNSTAAFYLRGRAWQDKHESDKAIADFSSVVRLDPQRADAYRARGELLYKNEKYKEAAADYSSLLRLNPQDTESYYRRATVRQNCREWAGSVDDFTESLNIRSDNYQAYLGRGISRYWLHAYDQAEEDFRECLRLQDQHAAAWCRTSWQNVFQGDLVRAQQSLGEFRTVSDGRVRTLLEMADCRHAQGDLAGAMVKCAEALQIDPRSSRAHHERGLIWFDKKRYDRAMADFDRALKFDPAFATTHHVLIGYCYHELGQYDKAQAELLEAFRLSPDNAGVCNGLSWFRATCPEAHYRDGKQAIELATKACRLTDWTSAAYLDTLAAAHAETGNFAEAVRWQKKALETVSPASKQEMTSRLALYESHKPYREP
jgi:tetratricopeptide (TPR) repeat protein